MVRDFEEIHIENTNSCGYKCVMCPRELQTRKIGYMSCEDFSLILSRFDHFTGNVHLHGFGEPLLDRSLCTKIRLLKERFPLASALIFSTLGVRVGPSFFEELAFSGLNDLIVSLYGFTPESYKNVHGFAGFELVQKNLSALSLAIKNSPLQVVVKVPSTQIFSTLPVADNGKRDFCTWLQQLGFQVREWSYVHNYGDGRKYNPSNEKLCPVIHGKRKNILNITWDLRVIPCCYDFDATICFGNLRTQTLSEIFTSEAYFQFTLAHQINNLSQYPICQNCEKNDYQ